MRITSVGHLVFASVMIALGIQGLHSGAFTAVWAPVPKGVPARDLLAYLCASVSLASGIGVLWKRTAALASRTLLAYLAVWWLVFRVWAIVRAPASFPVWDGCAETTAILAGAWALDVRLTADWGLRAARVLYGLALIPFGLAHFIYLQNTATLVPSWLPAHVAWAYFTGSAFLAAAVAVLTGVLARWGAALSALQIGLFTLLVWVPIVARGSKDPSDWSEFALSAAITAAAWVVADSYAEYPTGLKRTGMTGAQRVR